MYTCTFIKRLTRLRPSYLTIETHTDTQTRTDTYGHKQTHADTDIRTHTQTHTQANAHDKSTASDSHLFPRNLSKNSTFDHQDTHMHTHTCTHTHAHTLTYSRAHTHTHTHHTRTRHMRVSRKAQVWEC